MVKIEALAEELQKVMAQRYDKEFNEMRFFIDSAYEHGLADGKKQAKQEIIDMIKWEEKE
jgi:hypothetical protein